MPFSREQIEQFRQDTPGVQHRIHLNNAGAALMPLPVTEAIHRHIALEAEMGGYEAATAVRKEAARFYQAVGKLLNAPPENIAYATSATDAFNKALSAIPFQAEDVILTTHDDYVSNQIAFLQLQRRFGIRVVHAQNLPEGGADPDSVEALIRKYQPRLVAVTHVPTNSGLVQQVIPIGALCRRYGCLYLVDACQSAGQMPLDVESLQCDFLSATFRKFLRGPRGAGFLYVSQRVLDEGYEPLFLDLHSAEWADTGRYVPTVDARRFELWERSYALLLASRVAAEYASDAGLEPIRQRSSLLADLLRHKLEGLPGLSLLHQGASLCAIVTAHLPGHRPAPLHAALQHKGVNSSITYQSSALFDFREKGVEWALRLSPHYYNTEEEIEAAAEAIRSLL